MGRGRAKAKQQKVARDLKYNTQHTDLSALQSELSGSADKTLPTPAGPSWEDDDTTDGDGYDDDRWASSAR